MFFRKKKRIKVKVFYCGDEGYIAMASDGDRAVWNCYGSTNKAAKEMALYKLRKFQEEVSGG
ncbi:hypothetical protein [Neobacillus niacini]|uniref:hypothetical protein n=1 Tax=Neobacillus niacini TaxID=86668 RepID=UPI002858E703|nr:hypothetical protein [Neobacillus niacini]MDR6999680.1 hypothetical protein [Neobacillus niacini]